MGIHQNMSQVSRARKHIKWLEENYKNVSHYNLSLTKLFDEESNISHPVLSCNEFKSLIGFILRFFE